MFLPERCCFYTMTRLLIIAWRYNSSAAFPLDYAIGYAGGAVLSYWTGKVKPAWHEQNRN
ncbi:MAG: hypothetical protein DU429_06630 [Candidatus Tokpelaia sp.]|nr:MAG: hypothetical protein DU430_04380 [Candidatus Tokpelaia sp.]KAA6206231.1 MAG: hypothetical protein DU429_06630 [Candidatus Tokpelaia sp.]